MVGNAFTFQCSVAEVNAVNCQARGKGDVAEPQLELRRQLARQMMKNTLDGVPEVQEEVVEDRRRRRSTGIIQHTLNSLTPICIRAGTKNYPSVGFST